MNSSFYQLFLMNWRLLYRNRTGLFFTLAMPLIIFTALSILAISRFIQGGINYSQYILPGIIAMTIMQGGIYSLAYWMIDLKSRNVIKRFLVTPLKTKDLISSVLLSRILVAVLQAIFLTAVGALFFGIDLKLNMVFAFIFIILGASIFLLAGLLISTIADTYEAAAPITSVVGLPLTFLGNIFYPIDGLPIALKKFAEVLPITYMADGIRQSFFGNPTWSSVGFNILILMAWLVFMILITFRVFKLKE